MLAPEGLEFAELVGVEVGFPCTGGPDSRTRGLVTLVPEYEVGDDGVDRPEPLG